MMDEEDQDPPLTLAEVKTLLSAAETLRLAALRAKRKRLRGAARIDYLVTLPAEDREAIANREERARAALKLARMEEEHDPRLKVLRAKKNRLWGDARIEYLARLPKADRKKVADAEELRLVRTLYRHALAADLVQAVLQCTAEELARWDADGRLPHLFEHPPPTCVRCWSRPAIVAAGSKITHWRRKDQSCQSKSTRASKRPRINTA